MKEKKKKEKKEEQNLTLCVCGGDTLVCINH